MKKSHHIGECAGGYYCIRCGLMDPDREASCDLPARIESFDINVAIQTLKDSIKDSLNRNEEFHFCDLTRRTAVEALEAGLGDLGRYEFLRSERRNYFC